MKNTIQTKFVVECDLYKSTIFKTLNRGWREYRQELWEKRDDKTRSRDELIAMIPVGMDRDHWANFVDYRLDVKTKEIAKKNKENRKKQKIPHTGGSKSLAHKRPEMEEECGRKVSRGEVWTVTHKHANGTFVNDEARQISEKIQEYESSSVCLSQDISTQDSLAYALGSKEHCSRVRGIGLGPCPSQVFGSLSRSYSGMTSSTPYKELENQMATLKSQNQKLDEQNKMLVEQNKKFDAMMNFLMQNFEGQLPSDLAMFYTSLVSDEGSTHPTKE